MMPVPPPVEEAYVHIDLDVLDPSVGRANSFAAPGGLTQEDLVNALRQIKRRCRVGAAALTATTGPLTLRGTNCAGRRRHRGSACITTMPRAHCDLTSFLLCADLKTIRASGICHTNVDCGVEQVAARN